MAADRDISVNALVLELLTAAVGLDEGARRNRLSRYTTWTEMDLREFQDSLAAHRVVDPKLWS